MSKSPLAQNKQIRIWLVATTEHKAGEFYSIEGRHTCGENNIGAISSGYNQYTVLEEVEAFSESHGADGYGFYAT